ncbi:unnamed protein product [Callosobruchus maculatus]|uniref:Uncharacterized protein n=1 Tax=Callosobruchus maculatus TaxID=64391 RepID=A0A653BWI0_CALMS|nr:unnamed protein product [Callosobruchus maculatus]
MIKLKYDAYYGSRVLYYPESRFYNDDTMGRYWSPKFAFSRLPRYWPIYMMDLWPTEHHMRQIRNMTYPRDPYRIRWTEYRIVCTPPLWRHRVYKPLSLYYDYYYPIRSLFSTSSYWPRYVPISTFHNQINEGQGWRLQKIFDDETRLIRAQTASLLRRIHDPVPRVKYTWPTPYIDNGLPARLTNDYYIHKMLTSSPINPNVSYTTYYTEPIRRYIGPGHLSCTTYAGGMPYSRRSHLFLYEDPMRNDIQLLSFYINKFKQEKAMSGGAPAIEQSKVPLSPARPSRKFTANKQQDEDSAKEMQKMREARAARMDFLEQQAKQERHLDISAETTASPKKQRKEQEQTAMEEQEKKREEERRREKERKREEEKRMAEERAAEEEARKKAQAKKEEAERKAEQARQEELAAKAAAERAAELERQAELLRQEELAKQEELKAEEERKQLARLEELAKQAEEEREAELARQAEELAEIARQEAQLAEQAKREADEAELRRQEEELAELERQEAELAELERKEKELAEQASREAEAAKQEAELAEIAKQEAELAELERQQAELDALEAEAKALEADFGPEKAQEDNVDEKEAELARQQAEMEEIAKQEAELAELERQQAELDALEAEAKALEADFGEPTAEERPAADEMAQSEAATEDDDDEDARKQREMDELIQQKFELAELERQQAELDALEAEAKAMAEPHNNSDDFDEPAIAEDTPLGSEAEE